jgi:hypothetical protein
VKASAPRSFAGLTSEPASSSTRPDGVVAPSFSTSGPSDGIFAPPTYATFLDNTTPFSQEYPEFDFLFAPEGLQRAGIPLGDDTSLPL